MPAGLMNSTKSLLSYGPLILAKWESLWTGNMPEETQWTGSHMLIPD